MTKTNILILLSSFLLLAGASFGYQNTNNWLYEAESHIQKTDLSLYKHRGISYEKDNVSLEEKIAETDELYSNKKQLEALAHYQNLLKEDPANNELLLRIGIIYLQANQYKLAQENLEVVYADKDAAFALDGAWFLGLLQTKYGNKENATQFFEEVVKGRGNYHLAAQELLVLMA